MRGIERRAWINGVGDPLQSDTFPIMSLAQLEQETAALPSAELRALIARLFAVHSRREPGYEEELRRRMDDHEPSHWVSLEEAKKRL